MPSSVIRRFSYDEEAHRLDVTFVSGRRYSYRDVPAELALEMKLSFSKGEFFNKRIRGHFDFSPADLSTGGAPGAGPPTPPHPGR
jgi:hypothetical protein